MLHDIEHSLAGEGHVNVVPRHARSLERTQAVADVVGDVLEVHDARVVVVLAREEGRKWVGWVHIREGMGMRVPSAKAEIEASNARVVVVDDHDLLMMGPELNIIYTDITFG